MKGRDAFLELIKTASMIILLLKRVFIMNSLTYRNDALSTGKDGNFAKVEVKVPN